MLYEGIALIVVAVVVNVLTSKQNDRVLGKYAQPGIFYWPKYIFFYLLYRWRTSKIPKQDWGFDDGSDLRYLEDENDSNRRKTYDTNVGVGHRSKTSHLMMERTQSVADSKFAIDAVYFNGFEEKHPSVTDDITVIMGFTMRYQYQAEILFFVNVPGVGFLQHPAHPDRIICDASSDDYCYHGQGITVEMLEPMRKWKIKYNGLMRLMEMRDNDGRIIDGSGKLIHIKFSFIWRSYSSVIDFDTEISASCMANSFACEEWNSKLFDNVKKYHSHQAHYEQWGQLQGILQIENHEPKEIFMRGVRDHSFSKRDWRHFHRYILFMLHLEDGTSIHATCICMDVTLSRFSMGYILHPNLSKELITDIDLKIWEYGEDGTIPKEIKFNFTAGGKRYAVVCRIRITPEFFCGFEKEGRLYENLADFHVNGVPGRGIAEMYYRHDKDLRSISDCQTSKVKRYRDIEIDTITMENCLILNFDDELCRNQSLVGDKGCQLSLLREWASETKKFVVPNGFCLTTNAYRKHVQENTTIQSTFNELEKISTLKDDQVKQTCKRIMLLLQQSELDVTLSKALKKYCEEKKFTNGNLAAIRSSALGEDSCDLSAAGQCESIIGVTGFSEIVQAIKQCWGSMYSYNAVQYRRQNGQPIISSMAVIIQELAENTEKSGVMFTQHPVTDHPAQILINSNYGLGESVVSGSTEPDTFVVTCSPNNNPEVITREIGHKTEKVLENGKTIEKLATSPEETNKSSLSDEQIFQLVEIGRTIQNFYGSARDIEWAISKNGKVNLLQARPITFDSTESDFEILHEFDSAFNRENCIVTTSNIGEVVSGAITPLTSSTFARAVDYATQKFLAEGSPRKFFKYNDLMTSQSHSHLFLNYMEFVRLHWQALLGSRKESIDVNLLGYTYDELSHKEVVTYHDNCETIFGRIRNAVRFGKYLFGTKNQFNQLVEKNKELIFKSSNSNELYKEISEHLPFYAESWRSYMAYASFSGLSTTMLMTILSKGKSEWKTEHYSDVARIYETCSDVVSADAPTLLKKTAKHVHESKDKENFIKMSTKQATDWLLQDQSKAGESFRLFLKSCGHRCLNEMEMREKPWADDPSKLGISIQATVKNYVEEKTQIVLSTEEIIEKLNTPLSLFGKFFLKYAIPYARKSVSGREWGKSNAIKISNKFKKAYQELAKMMHEEGYIPDPDLVYFLTHGEIGRLLRTRCPKLLRRASRRRRMHKRKSELVFADFHTKVPVAPLKANEIKSQSVGNLKIQGFPVSHGVVKGIARVTLRMEDADEIKQGEILIVRSTDVGWSPYFPLVSGLVTEIGGLISHGAVVAREYGLPCIVSAKRATHMFKTGDSVLLDGGKGTIQKLPC